MAKIALLFFVICLLIYKANTYPQEAVVREINRNSVQEESMNERMCRKFYEDDARTKRDLTIFANRTTVGDYPHMAAIGYAQDDGSLRFYCNGFLVDPRYVITASTCLTRYGSPTHIRLGGVSLSNQTIQDTDLAIDPDGKISSDAAGDIGVLRLAAPTSIRPACLWPQPYIPYETLTAIGYNPEFFNNTENLDELVRMDLSIYDNGFCESLYEIGLYRRVRGVEYGQLCVGRPVENQMHHSYSLCGYNAGSPLGTSRKRAFSKTPVPYVMGFYSHGYLCTTTPAEVYTKLSPNLRWLESVIWPNDCSI